MGGDARFCTFCGSFGVTGLKTMDGKEICHACLEARKAAPPAPPCSICGKATPGGVTFHGVKTCLDCNARQTFPERCAKADIIAEQSAAKVPVNIIARSRSIDRSEHSMLIDRIGQIEHDAWEAGFEAAVRIVEHEGATALAEILRNALADYWETQGVERED